MPVTGLGRIVADALGPDVPRRIGVAVSGGGDSTALLHALIEAGFAVEAVTVDHGLRPESFAEAEAVGADCAALGAPHHILRWRGDAARGNLMDAARRARIDLIGAWARARGIGDIALGHTADDQAETFLMRIAREAGLEGLSGIRPRFAAAGVTWHRPLLGIGRADLRDWLRARGIGWIEDPSNDNDRFGRVRARKALGGLAPAGVTVASVNAVVGHLAQANAAFGRILGLWARDHVRTLGGEVRFSEAAFAALDPELRRRLVGAALIWVAGADYAPRAAKVAGFLMAPRDCTLHGCRIRIARREVRIAREIAALRGLAVDFGADWDGWRVSGPAPEGAQVAALAAGIAECPGWRETGLSRAAAVASPAVWLSGRLVAAPVVRPEAGWNALNRRGSFADTGFSR